MLASLMMIAATEDYFELERDVRAGAAVPYE
jgi:hypothetical protein